MTRIGIIIVVLASFMFSAVAEAQDLITLRTGEEIQAKVLEIGTDEISYLKYSNLSGPTYRISRNLVFMIEYENGGKDVFGQECFQESSFRETCCSRDIPVGIVPGMKYRDYRKLYKGVTYTPMQGDPHIPVVSGICSFLIPGLGQMIDGEVGRGFAWLGGSVGAVALTSVGAAVAGTGQLAVGATLSVLGTIALLAIDISAIVDAVSVAKTKNMYSQDVMKLKKREADFQVRPYVGTTQYTPAVQGGQPVAGLTLSISF